MNGFGGQNTKAVLGRTPLCLAFLVLSVFFAGCVDQDLTLPTSGEVENAYLYPGGLEARMRGNVAEVTITQAARDLRKGGTLWAKVGPYVLLFSEETEGLFTGFPGLAGVRVITVSSDGNEVARALLARDSLNGITWRRALHIAGLARRDGTRRPSLLEELVDWGEDHTEYTYDHRYSRP